MDQDMPTMASTTAHDMAVSSTTMNMDMPAATTGMSHHDMGGMSMSMADMIMTFFTSARTPLYSQIWTPSNDGGCAATCIFLIVLASLLRLLLALRPILERRIWRSHVVSEVDSEQSFPQNKSPGLNDRLHPGQMLSQVGRDVGAGWSGWRVGPAAARATYEVVVGVGYLL
ncbi:hypothetical protein HJFPF1_02287 [Paramyrothecium foliicola]|nr:hypothetical protein HJFPF1_02287 [Paramyrothecium foliicola]